jgi:predicted membrane-bound mannosyltransferase
MHSECNNVAYHWLENKYINTMENAILLCFFSLLKISPCLCVCLLPNDFGTKLWIFMKNHSKTANASFVIFLFYHQLFSVVIKRISEVGVSDTHAT